MSPSSFLTSQNIRSPSKKISPKQFSLWKSATQKYDSTCRAWRFLPKWQKYTFCGFNLLHWKANRVKCSANTVLREQNNLAFCNTITTVSGQIKRDSNETLAFIVMQNQPVLKKIFTTRPPVISFREGNLLRSSLSINALRSCVYIYIWQLSSLRAPTLWFIYIWLLLHT